MISVVGEWLDVVYKVLTGIFVIWLYLDRKNDKTNQRISELENSIDERLDNHSERLTRIESDLKNAPSHYDLGKIYDEMRKQSEAIFAVDKAVNKLNGAFEPLENLVSRMDAFWRSKGN